MNSELILYTTEDGVIKVDVTFIDETVWLTQEQMADLFQKSKSTINEHIKNIYSDGELNQSSTMRKFGNSEFSTKPTNYYNLDMIISVGYRVRSQRGVQFRIWASEILKEYIIVIFSTTAQIQHQIFFSHCLNQLFKILIRNLTIFEHKRSYDHLICTTF